MQQAAVLQEHSKATHVVDNRRGPTRVKAAPQQVRMEAQPDHPDRCARCLQLRGDRDSSARGRRMRYCHRGDSQVGWMTPTGATCAAQGSSDT